MLVREVQTISGEDELGGVGDKHQQASSTSGLVSTMVEESMACTNQVDVEAAHHINWKFRKSARGVKTPFEQAEKRSFSILTLGQHESTTQTISV
ncbi:Os08g0386050 [Oryza sativa Japonica Group]|jgi:hypothetical protein|uniref:Os08g0386050 protein n=1 Tax=Oryza sativa subsp. japonica TaxID=39947 RepID=A0A0P0XFR5_ORYSJ|nr:Os08g0386050 [Oryza sativa Japonica Group]